MNISELQSLEKVLPTLLVAILFILSTNPLSADDQDDYEFVATLASIDYTEPFYLKTTSPPEVLFSTVAMLHEQERLKEINSRHPGGLGDAATEISQALPLLNNLYLQLQANDLEGLPLALLVEFMSQQAFENDLRRYESHAQSAAQKMVHYMREMNFSEVSPGDFPCTFAPGSLEFVNMTGEHLRDCTVVVTASDIFDETIQVVAFVEDWPIGAEADVSSGRRFSFGSVTDVTVEVLCWNRRYEEVDFTFPERVNAAVEFACLDAERLLKQDKFGASKNRASSLSTIIERRGIDGYEDRLSRIQSLSDNGLELVPERDDWVDYFRNNTIFVGTYRRPSRKARTAVSCSVIRISEGNGDLQLLFSVFNNGRRSETFRAFGRIDIMPEAKEIVVEVKKESSRKASGVERLTFRRSRNGLTGVDESRGRIVFKPKISRR